LWCASHQQGGFQEVAHGVALTQEFGIRHNRKALGTAQTLGGQFLAGAGENGTAHRHDEAAAFCLPGCGDLAADSAQLIEAQVSVALGGRAYADQNDLRLLDGRLEQCCRRQTAVGVTFLD